MQQSPHMPVVYTVLPEQRIISLTAEDPLLPMEAVDALSKMTGDVGAANNGRILVDARKVYRSPEGALEASLVLLRLLEKNGIERVAFLVENEEVKRTLDQVADRMRDELSVASFQYSDAAMAWLSGERV